MANNQLKVEGLAPRVLPQSTSKEKYVPEFTGGRFDGYSDPLDLIIQIFDERKKYEGQSELPSYLANTISSDNYVKESDKYFNPSPIATPFYTRYALNSAAKERGYEDLISEEDYSDERLIDSENVQVLKQLATRISEEGKERDLTPVEIGFLDRYPSMIADRTGMAKGGLAMDDQMDKLFMARGGLKDDGMNMDPVSGNEIPPGSLAQEVRDDIPAQLSDGEYVVPADVVRYYGVKFFEDLRQEAKTGLSDMEMNGRIGGEPAPEMGASMSQDSISPELLVALAKQSEAGEPMRMASGGLSSPRAGFMQGPGFTSLLRDRFGDERADELVFGKDKKDKEEKGPQYKSETPSFYPLNYMQGYPGIVGSSTIGQLAYTLPPLSYRYIDPVTGKVIPVAPGETPPAGAIPAPAEPEEPFDPYEGRDDRPAPEVVDPADYDPTNMAGINYVDPMAGVQSAYDAAFGEKKSTGILGGLTSMIGGGVLGELNKLDAISKMNANLSLVGEQYGVDSPEYASAKAIVDDALGKTKLDNVLPETFYNGTGRLGAQGKKLNAYLNATGNTLEGLRGASAGAGAGVKSSGGGDGPRVSPRGNNNRDESDSDERRAAESVQGGGEYSGVTDRVTTKGYSDPSPALSDDYSYDRPTDRGAYDTSYGSGSAGEFGGMGYGSVSVAGGDPELGFYKGGLMKRKSPVKRK